MPGIRARVGRPSLGTVAGGFALLAFGAVFLGLAWAVIHFFGYVVGGVALVVFVIGAALFPAGPFVLWWRLPKSLAEMAAFHYLKFGLRPFREPVFQLGLGGYDIVEGADGEVGGSKKYRLAGKWVGFSIKPEDADALFEGIAEEPKKIWARKPAEMTDGGVAATDAPPGYVVSDSLEVEGVKPYIPKRVDNDGLYARVDRAMSPFRNAARGSRVDKAIEIAKEKFGNGWQPLSDKMVIVATLVAAIVGMVAGFVVFFL
jgi:hypothetical protein